MSNTSYDFLTESFLFDERYIEDHYRKVSEKELCLELQKYREYIQKNYTNIVEETQNKSQLNITIKSVGKLPSEQLLKQLALYMDRVVISDPIFEFTPTKSELHILMSNLMGVNHNSSMAC